MQEDLSHDLLERTILGTMLIEHYLILDVDIKLDMFKSTIHRRIYVILQELASTKQPIDVLTILLKAEDPQDVGGANYVAGLKDYARVEEFDDYLRLLIEEWDKQETRNIIYQAYVEKWSREKVLESLNQLEITTMDTNYDITNDLKQLAEYPFQPLEEPRGISTMISELDQLTEGFQPGDVTIIAGRPSMGKTDVMVHFAMQAGWAGYLPIIFSLEMDRKKIIFRLITYCGKINRLKLRNPGKHFTEQQFEQWKPVLKRVEQANIYIDDESGMTVKQIRAKARRIIRTNPMKKPIIFIDYLQIIHSDIKGNPTVAIGEISMQLKKMAKEFNCPIVCLAQLNRGVETRQDKRPLMSDLRDSGNIEQDADVIILLYRDGYYAQMKPEELNRGTKSKQDILEFIVAKNRNGPTGIAYATYNKSTGIIKGMNEIHDKSIASTTTNENHQHTI